MHDFEKPIGDPLEMPAPLERGYIQVFNSCHCAPSPPSIKISPCQCRERLLEAITNAENLGVITKNRMLALIEETI